MASHQQDPNPEKHNARLHTSILATRNGREYPCAVADTRRKDRRRTPATRPRKVFLCVSVPLWQILFSGSSDLVDALDAEDPGNFADIGKNRFQLAAVGNFQAGIDPRIHLVRPALQAVDI